MRKRLYFFFSSLSKLIRKNFLKILKNLSEFIWVYCFEKLILAEVVWIPFPMHSNILIIF